MSTAEEPQSKTARLEARITQEQKKLIEKAAAYEGRTLSDFVVNTVQQAAQAVIRDREVLRLNESQSRAFVEAILTPSQPNEALQRGAGEYRRDVASR